MSYKKIGEINIYECICERCGHKWESMGKNKPNACAKCKNRAWDKKREKK